MGHSQQTHERHYQESNVEAAVVGHQNISRFGETESDSSQQNSGVALKKAASRDPFTKKDFHVNKRQRQTGLKSRISRLRRPSESSLGSAAEDRASLEFFRSFPLTLAGSHTFTDADAAKFGKSRRALKDKYRNAQTSLREDLLAFELFEKHQNLTTQQAEWFTEDASRTRGWRIDCGSVCRRLEELRKFPLTPDERQRLKMLIESRKGNQAVGCC
jgi:hypothetical protein